MAEEPSLKLPQPVMLRSWLNVYSKAAYKFVCNCDEEIEAIANVIADSKPIGSSHSYNRSHFSFNAMKLGERYDYVHADVDFQYRVGGAATVESVMLRILKDGRRLANSGNHRKQTFVGACVGGTHGFGRNATMMDCVQDMKVVAGVTTEMTISTKPVTQFTIAHCVCPLSDLNEQSTKRSYAVFIHSGDDPICIVSDFCYSSGQNYYTLKSIQASEIRSWWRLRVIRFIQRFQKRFSFLHRFAQRFIGLAKMKTWHSVTLIGDIDATYHPWPEADKGGAEGNILYHSQRPTHQYHNVAFGCLPSDTADVILLIKSKMGKRLAGFIGVRELTTRSDYVKALNFDGPRNAIDCYFWLDQNAAKYGEELQELLRQSDFDIRWHPSKSTKAAE